MATKTVSTMKALGTINLLAGLWLFISPWVYRVSSIPNAWNSWVIGVLIALFAWMRVSSPEDTRGISVVNLVLGAWTFISPWVYGYAGDTGRFVNSLCVGAIVFILALIASSMGHMTSPPAVQT